MLQFVANCIFDYREQLFDSKENTRQTKSRVIRSQILEGFLLPG